MALEFSAAVGRIPVYPAAAGYALPEDVALMASNESPDPPLPQVVQAVTRVLAGSTAIPTRRTPSCAGR
jgi:histidinol-phosphate aminotransferase